MSINLKWIMGRSWQIAAHPFVMLGLRVRYLWWKITGGPGKPDWMWRCGGCGTGFTEDGPRARSPDDVRLCLHCDIIDPAWDQPSAWRRLQVFWFRLTTRLP